MTLKKAIGMATKERNSAVSQLRHIPRRFFYNETRKPRTIGKNSWLPGFLMELLLVAASPRCAFAVQSVGIIVRCEDFSISPMNLAGQETCNLLMQVHQKVVIKMGAFS